MVESEIKVLPVDNKEASHENALGAAIFTTQGGRSYQEDAAIWHQDSRRDFTPEQLERVLRDTHLKLDELATPETVENSGCTASTNYYDGQGNIVTATLGDAVSFAVVYGLNGDVLKVKRLNDVIHKPTDPEERKRIESLKGFIMGKRVWSAHEDSKGREHRLAISRAIGDSEVVNKERQPLISAESHIDATSISELCSGIEDIGEVVIIAASDGFTDGAARQNKEGHEQYLEACLKDDAIKGLRGVALCEALSKQAMTCGSSDNITVAIQTIYKDVQNMQTPVLLGVYDGHGGKETSTLVANKIYELFSIACNQLTSSSTLEAFESPESSTPEPRHQEPIEEGFNSDSDTIADIENAAIENAAIKYVDIVKSQEPMTADVVSALMRLRSDFIKQYQSKAKGIWHRAGVKPYMSFKEIVEHALGKTAGYKGQRSYSILCDIGVFNENDSGKVNSWSFMQEEPHKLSSDSSPKDWSRDDLNNYNSAVQEYAQSILENVKQDFYAEHAKQQGLIMRFFSRSAIQKNQSLEEIIRHAQFGSEQNGHKYSGKRSLSILQKMGVLDKEKNLVDKYADLVRDAGIDINSRDKQYERGTRPR